MAVDVTTETIIERPIEAVATFAGDPANAPLWYSNITRVDVKTPAPLRAGSLITFVAHFLGKRLEYTYEVTKIEPGRCLVMRTAEGPFPMETTYAWTPLDESKTRMTLKNRGQPSGFSSLTAPFMSFAVRRANRQDLRRLKAILEAGPASPPFAS